MEQGTIPIGGSRLFLIAMALETTPGALFEGLDGDISSYASAEMSELSPPSVLRESKRVAGLAQKLAAHPTLAKSPQLIKDLNRLMKSFNNAVAKKKP